MSNADVPYPRWISTLSRADHTKYQSTISANGRCRVHAGVRRRRPSTVADIGGERYRQCGREHRACLWQAPGMPIDANRRLNLLNWEDRVPIHTSSGDYALHRFREDPAFLSYVVRFDRERLGSLDGLDVVHLQCHIGTDTVSLSRLGAATTTGYDFSPSALAAARTLAAEAGAA